METTNAPILPAYGEGCLTDLLPGISHHLTGRGSDPLGLPASRRYVILLVDGLGDLLLSAARTSAPYLWGKRVGSITSGVPSTTVTSITSLGTGLHPGQHGMVGYSFREPGGQIFNALAWDAPIEPADLQPRLTAFERLHSSGVAVANVSPARFGRSGLTSVALQGGTFLGVPDENDEELRIALTVQASAAAASTVVYSYERHLDHTGHGMGCGSEQWLDELIRIDIFAERLRQALPADATLIITGDHGMVDIAQDRFVIVEDEPELMAEVAQMGGEGRLRQLYVAPGREAAVQQRWADRLGSDAWVLTRAEAIEAGWFGTVEPSVAPRIGDVLVAMSTDAAVMTRTLAHELNLVGMHGSLTAHEMLVPLIVA